MAERYIYPSEAELTEAEILLREKAKRHKKAIEELLRTPEVGKSVTVLPGDPKKEPVIALVVDNGESAKPEIHDNYSDVWLGVEAPDGMEFTLGGVLVPKLALQDDKGKIVPGEFVGDKIEGNGAHTRSYILKPGATLMTGYREPHGHQPKRGDIAGALVLKIPRK